MLANQVVKIAPAVKINTVYLLFSQKHCTWLRHLLMAEKYHLLTETHGRGPGRFQLFDLVTVGSKTSETADTAKQWTCLNFI